MIKKYLIRIVGALCILGVLALMIMPSWIKLDGISRRDMRDTRTDILGITERVRVAYLDYADASDDNEEHLEDYDLPTTRGKIKSRFNDIDDLAKELLDDQISLKEVFMLSVKAPGLMKDANNFLESDLSPLACNYIASYILMDGSKAVYDTYEDEVYEHIDKEAAYLQEEATNIMDTVEDYSLLAYIPAVVLILIAILFVASAATHICNKGRWLKYLALVILVAMVVGSCVALPMASEMISDMAVDTPLSDLTLKITVFPFLALALMIAPIVLDIIFEKKKKNNIVEEVNNG